MLPVLHKKMAVHVLPFLLQLKSDLRFDAEMTYSDHSGHFLPSKNVVVFRCIGEQSENRVRKSEQNLEKRVTIRCRDECWVLFSACCPEAREADQYTHPDHLLPLEPRLQSCHINAETLTTQHTFRGQIA